MIFSTVKAYEPTELTIGRDRTKIARAVVVATLRQPHDLKGLRTLRGTVWDYKRSLADKLPRVDDASAFADEDIGYRYCLCLEVLDLLEGKRLHYLTYLLTVCCIRI